MIFSGILNSEKSDAYKLKCNFADHPLRKLIKISKAEFDSALLKNELMVLQGSEYLRGKSSYEVLRRLRGSNMAKTFEQTYKLATLIPTFPPTTASAERRFSAARPVFTTLEAKTQSVNSHSCQQRRTYLHSSRNPPPPPSTTSLLKNLHRNFISNDLNISGKDFRFALSLLHIMVVYDHI